MRQRTSGWTWILVVAILTGFFASSAQAKPKPKKLKDELTLLWVIEERIDGEVSDRHTLERVMKAELTNIQLVPVTGEKKKLASKCNVDSMLKDKFCDDVTIKDADIVIAGTVQADAKVSTKKSKNVGYQVKVKLNMFNVETKESYGSLSQSSYATGLYPHTALQKALEKILEPMTILISLKTYSIVAGERVAKVDIKGLPDKEQFDNLLLHFPMLKLVSEARVVNLDVENAQMKVVFHDGTISGLVRSINKYQGLGLKATVKGPLEIEAEYYDKKALSFIVYASSVEDRTPAGLKAADAAKMTPILRAQIDELWRFARIIDTGTDTYNAKSARKFHDDWAGDFIVTGKILMGAGTPVLELTARHYQFGDVATIRQEDTGNLKTWVGSAVNRLQNELLIAMDHRVNRLPKLQEAQYRAYRGF